MEDWDKKTEDPSLLLVQPRPSNVNKWAGEDEDDVMDSWDLDEEKKDEEKAEIKMVKTKPKKSLAEKIAEKERTKQEEEEAKLKEVELSPEQQLAEKLRVQKAQEEADLRAAMDTFGIAEKDRCPIDLMNPTNKTELNEFSEALSKKIGQYKQMSEFPQFVEELVRGVCSSLTSMDMQKIKKTVDTLYSEKQKMEREKSKKGGKGKGKATIRKIDDNENIKDYGDDPFDYDDFM